MLTWAAARSACPIARPVAQRPTAGARLSASTVKGAESSLTSTAAAIVVLGGGFVGVLRWFNAPEVLLSPACSCVRARARACSCAMRARPWPCACAARCVLRPAKGFTPRACMDSGPLIAGAGAGRYVTGGAGSNSGEQVQRGHLECIQGGVGVGRWRRNLNLHRAGARAQNVWLLRPAEGGHRATVVSYHGLQFFWLCGPR